MKKAQTVRSLVVVGSVCYALLFVYMLAAHPGIKKFYETFFNVYQIFTPLLAGICGVVYFLRGKHPSPFRRVGWLLIGLGCLSFAAGQITWTYYESIRGVEVPFPGWADAGYLGAYPCLIIGVLFLFGSMAVAGRTRLILDSAIAASSIGMLSWYFVIEPIWHKSDITLWGKFVSAAYPLGDVVTIFSVIVLFKAMTSDRELRRSLGFVAVGMAMIAFADTVFTIMTLNNTYHTGSWADWGWSFGWMLVGYALLLPMWWPIQAIAISTRRAVSFRRGVAFQAMLPYLAAFGSFGVVCVRDYNTPPLHQINTATLASGLALILLVVARQVFTLLENQQLTNQVRLVNEHLEETVDQRTFELRRRTHQLTSLHQLTKAITTTLDFDEVLTEALKNSLLAVGADAALIRLCESKEVGASQKIVRQNGFADHPEVLEWIKGMPLCQTMETLALPQTSTASASGMYLHASLQWQGQALGMIGFVRWQSGFEETEFDLVESIALEVGTALNNARQYCLAVDAADRDAVTGLFNHRAIHQRLDQQFDHALQLSHPLSVIMMDLDNFKLFNDTYGHPVGDQVLKRVAEALRQGCDKHDLIGRYGGDEFLIVLSDMTGQDAKLLAEILRDQIRIECFHKTGDGRIIPVALSFGIAEFPQDGANRHELLTNADINLYDAKERDGGIVLTTEDQRTNRHFRSEGSFGILDSMVTAVDNKDRYTRKHSEDVTTFSLWIAEELGLSDETMRDIRIGGLLHDVGKIGVPDEILRKPGRLTDEEYEVMKQHTHLGSLIVGALPGMETVVEAVRSHHERWDGKGYPDATAGEETPLLGRVLAVADAFSAMTTTRPYRVGMDWETALGQIEANIGAQFDPAMAAAFLIAAQKRLSRDQALLKAA